MCAGTRGASILPMSSIVGHSADKQPAPCEAAAYFPRARKSLAAMIHRPHGPTVGQQRRSHVRTGSPRSRDSGSIKFCLTSGGESDGTMRVYGRDVHSLGVFRQDSVGRSDGIGVAWRTISCARGAAASSTV